MVCSTPILSLLVWSIVIVGPVGVHRGFMRLIAVRISARVKVLLMSWIVNISLGTSIMIATLAVLRPVFSRSALEIVIQMLIMCMLCLKVACR